MPVQSPAPVPDEPDDPDDPDDPDEPDEPDEPDDPDVPEEPEEPDELLDDVEEEVLDDDFASFVLAASLGTNSE